MTARDGAVHVVEIYCAVFGVFWPGINWCDSDGASWPQHSEHYTYNFGKTVPQTTATTPHTCRLQPTIKFVFSSQLATCRCWVFPGLDPGPHTAGRSLQNPCRFCSAICIFNKVYGLGDWHRCCGMLTLPLLPWSCISQHTQILVTVGNKTPVIWL